MDYVDGVQNALYSPPDLAEALEQSSSSSGLIPFIQESAKQDFLEPELIRIRRIADQMRQGDILDFRILKSRVSDFVDILTLSDRVIMFPRWMSTEPYRYPPKLPFLDGLCTHGDNHRDCTATD